MKSLEERCEKLQDSYGAAYAELDAYRVESGTQQCVAAHTPTAPRSPCAGRR